MTIWKLTLGAWFGVFDVFVVVSFFVCFFVLRLVGWLVSFLGGLVFYWFVVGFGFFFFWFFWFCLSAACQDVN